MTEEEFNRFQKGAALKTTIEAAQGIVDTLTHIIPMTSTMTIEAHGDYGAVDNTMSFNRVDTNEILCAINQLFSDKVARLQKEFDEL